MKGPLSGSLGVVGVWAEPEPDFEPAAELEPPGDMLSMLTWH